MRSDASSLSYHVCTLLQKDDALYKINNYVTHNYLYNWLFLIFNYQILKI